jgi:hypothetical protein
MAANRVGDSRKLADGVNVASDWSLDRRFLLFFRRSEKTRNDIWVLPLERRPQRVRALQFTRRRRAARFTADGAWIAYASDESGPQEVYVRSFTRDGHIGADRKRVSSSGGAQPIWRRDGKELFYLSSKGEIAVSVNRSDKATSPDYESPSLHRTKDEWLWGWDPDQMLPFTQQWKRYVQSFLSSWRTCEHSDLARVNSPSDVPLGAPLTRGSSLSASGFGALLGCLSPRSSARLPCPYYC